MHPHNPGTTPNGQRTLFPRFRERTSPARTTHPPAAGIPLWNHRRCICDKRVVVSNPNADPFSFLRLIQHDGFRSLLFSGFRDRATHRHEWSRSRILASAQICKEYATWGRERTYPVHRVGGLFLQILLRSMDCSVHFLASFRKGSEDWETTGTASRNVPNCGSLDKALSYAPIFPDTKGVECER